MFLEICGAISKKWAAFCEWLRQLITSMKGGIAEKPTNTSDRVEAEPAKDPRLTGISPRVRDIETDPETGLRIGIEFYPKNPDCCALHLSKKITQQSILTFESPDWQLDKKTKMVDELFEIAGIAKITLQPYEVHLCKGRVFAWDEILPAAKEAVRRHFANEAVRALQEGGDDAISA